MKILLITDVPPSDRYSGTLLSLKMTKCLPKGSLVGYYLLSSALKNERSQVDPSIEVASIYEVKNNEWSFRPRWLWRFNFFASLLREQHRKYWHVRQIHKRVEKAIQDHKIDHVWIILQGQTLIFLCERLLKKHTVPIHVQYWDHPNWWMKANQIDRFSRSVIRRCFNYCLTHADKIGLPSFNAADLMGDLLNQSPCTLIETSPEPIFSAAPPRADTKIIIGIAGQLYATDTLKCLFKALEHCNWEIEGRKIEIHYWGYSSAGEFEDKIVRYGYKPQSELMKDLQNCDIVYLPYWFDSAYETEARTSSPAKMMTYLASGRPILFHGPRYSSPGILLHKHGAGATCFSPEVEPLLYSIRRILLEEGYAKSLIDQASKLMAGDLSRDRIESEYFKFLEP